MRSSFAEPAVSEQLVAELTASTRPLRGPADLTPLLERIGDCKIVMLGESTHGTADYYRWRRLISEKLITEHGFSFLAVEGDWPDCYEINRFIKGESEHTSAETVLARFRRWPTWMWANEEVLAFANELRDYNARMSTSLQRIGFFGLDVYSLWRSLGELTQLLLAEEEPEAHARAQQAMECYRLIAGNSRQEEGFSRLDYQRCERQILALLGSLRQRDAEDRSDGSERRFLIEQSARIITHANAYYREMLSLGPQSWNIRDAHMAETLDRLLRFHGEGAKAIVWAHNSHIGDARYTDMAQSGRHNLGQLARATYGQHQVALVGFGSYEGSVLTARAWGAPGRRLGLPPARCHSWEDLFHTAVGSDALFLPPPAMDGAPRCLQPRGQRAVGVVYGRQADLALGYAPTVLPLCYDAWLYLDRTTALCPLAPNATASEDLDAPETYPSAV